MIIVDNNGVIIDVGNITSESNYITVTKENGEVVNYMNRDLVIIDTPVNDGVVAQKYQYINGVFSLNPNYVEVTEV